MKTTRRIGLTVGLYLMTLYLPAMVIGFTAFYFLPEADSDGSFPLLLATYAPAWFAGLIVAGGLAAGMSSLDADTNANSAMLTKDVYASFVRKNATDRHYIAVGRLFVVGLVAITVAAGGVSLGPGCTHDRRHRLHDHAATAGGAGGNRSNGNTLYQGGASPRASSPDLSWRYWCFSSAPMYCPPVGGSIRPSGGWSSMSR